MNEQTRRNWLVTISQTAVCLGVAGNAVAKPETDNVLPPGVYRPSSDHLSHALMNSARYHSVPPGCPTDYVQPNDGQAKPLFFSAADFQVIRRLAELLLGEESSAVQGVGLEVAQWIDLRVSSSDGVRGAVAHIDASYRTLATAYFGPAHDERIASEDPAKICREGLEWISHASTTQYSKNFLLLDQGQQIAILRSISDERSNRAAENAGTRLFDFLKAETIKGFYTSQVGLKELDFKGNAFYSRSPGCHSK